MQHYSEWTSPLEKGVCRGNQLPFMNETLPKAIMQRSKVRKISSKKELNKTEIIILNRGAVLSNKVCF